MLHGNSDWETIEYAFMDRYVKITPELGRWRASIQINDVGFQAVGLTPGLAVEHLAETILHYVDVTPHFYITREDIKK